ncbi:hypothetical protein QUC31_000093 [Theobroma cacao]|uniref:Heat stress transcription factor A-2c, putative n=1 Tax=Theobroma cacao TaxID=3641 RepID=A0A061FJA6_THECC|nr:Heat stress transcription factor A-2c, putative [Theobroma cacao]WRX31034.1 Protein of unknown function DUF1645 [Theobroma cacao]
MEVVIPAAPVMDFDFNSARSSPRSSAPSTPRRFGECFFSAPTSPSRMSEFYREFDRFSMMNDRQSSIGSSSLAIPFDWEEKPGTPKSPRATGNDEEEDDFAFDFSEALEKTSLPAEELFDGGKIKPLKPPPRLQVDECNQKSPLLSSPRSPRSPLSQGKKIIREAFSPRKKKNRDPFATAIESSRNDTEHGRGRERVQDFSSRNSSRRATRSLSPYRVSEYPWEEEEKQQQHETTKQSPLNSKPSLSSTSSKSSSRKWRLRDFLLFRSASEGRATDKDPFRKYSLALFKKPEADTKNSSSFRSTDSSGSVGSRRKISAHELHYTTNKAVSENMKKKTFLPYKQGILGRLAFNPAVHALANGFGALTRS